MKQGGIIKRWFTHSFLVVIAVLIAAVTITAFSVQRYYYNSVRSALEYRANSAGLNNLFSMNADGSEEQFLANSLDYLENFSEKNLMEVWVINGAGAAVAASTGFPVTQAEMRDYAAALASENGRGVWIGRNVNGEKIMALTVFPTSDLTGRSGAVRYISSLEDIDAQFYRVLFFLSVFALAAIGFTAFSGAFFIGSIVRPVKDINEKSKILAGGDFSAKIETYTQKDEIGELCETFNDMAQAIRESDRMKNDFISTVSHELRTPLTAIKGWSETIRYAPDPQTVQMGMDVILSETERLDAMVTDLLDFSKMESGRLALRFQKIDGFAELQETVLVFSDRAVREGVAFHYEIPDGGAAVINADPARLRQVFVNIIDNAFKYKNAARPMVAVSAAVSSGQFKVLVSDNGCGISKEDLPHVTEKFYKANIAVKGSGIGLAVCDELIRLHGGSLHITSEEDVGTTVEVLLPLM
ncbi:MAG: HAMP domain-containing histidine kinase [Clostridia bacterium]|nr:HAMP domain-containing histidine kinase [Clostridia bacterium]